jgi:hypothetical protein
MTVVFDVLRIAAVALLLTAPWDLCDEAEPSERKRF